MPKSICFDMDGTLCDFYGVPNWLEYLMNADPTPYAIAKPLLNLSALARHIHRLQRQGYTVNIISWLSKSATPAFEAEVTQVKLAWLAKHLPSVTFDSVAIVPYGTPKYLCGTGILFDDEERNRNDWQGLAYDADEILKILRGI